MKLLIPIFIGGGLGAISRYGLHIGIDRLTAQTVVSRFPLGILLCNLLGCFAIGLFIGWFEGKGTLPSLWIQPAVVVGFLGAFTTYSTFALDTNRLFQTSPALATLNIALSVIGSLGAVWLGFKVTS